MFGNKYGKVLTIILIVAIVIIIGLLCFFGYDQLTKSKNNELQTAVIEEFDRKHNILSSSSNSEDSDSTPKPEESSMSEEEIQQILNSGGSSVQTGNASGSNNQTYMNGFLMVGKIEIPKTNVKLAILDVVTKKSLETSVAILYPTNAKLNEPGNVVIAGHNYRNQMFFSNNKKLEAGDKIYITDESGRKMTYVVYDKFEAKDTDTSFYVRDTAGKPEITLTTCTQDNTKRTIILAKAE